MGWSLFQGRDAWYFTLWRNCALYSTTESLEPRVHSGGSAASGPNSRSLIPPGSPHWAWQAGGPTMTSVSKQVANGSVETASACGHGVGV